MDFSAALRHGLSTEQTQEVLLQCAIYAGVPAANRAFAVAQGAIDAIDHPVNPESRSEESANKICPCAADGVADIRNGSFPGGRRRA